MMVLSLLRLLHCPPLHCPPLASHCSYCLPSCCLSMPSSRVSSEPWVASGFDILSDMIRHVHRTNHLDLSVFAPDQLPWTAASTLINAGRNLKSLFTGAFGKRVKVGSVDPIPTKCCFVVTPLTATASTTPGLATIPFLAMTPHSQQCHAWQQRRAW
jgi:hypothetical protein